MEMGNKTEKNPVSLALNNQPPASKNQKKIVFLALFGILIICLATFALSGFLSRKQKTTNEPSPDISVTPEPPTAMPALPDTSITVMPEQSGISYSLPQGWEKYSDNESGISIYYPPGYVSKYNPNRGVGISFAAGSYLLNSSGEKMMDFYKFPYDGGSRRLAFYKMAEFDGPEDMSKYTILTEDVVINSKTYLKLVSSYYATAFQGEGNRTFLLIPVGNTMYYFTYPAKYEQDKPTLQNLMTIVGNATLSGGEQAGDVMATACYPFAYDPATDKSWTASIDSGGNLVIVQKTDVVLNRQVVDKSRIEAWTNYQGGGANDAILDFEIKIDTSQKGDAKDAFIITIAKNVVDDIAQKTPDTIPSVSVSLKVNGGLETEDGKKCTASAPKIYFTNRQ